MDLVQNWLHKRSSGLLRHSMFYFLLPKEWSEIFVLSELQTNDTVEAACAARITPRKSL